MWKLPKRVPSSLVGRLASRSYAAEGQPASAPAAAKPSQPSPPQQASQPPPPQPPPPSGSGGGVFWKVLGLTVVVGGGTLGYAWYDSNFRKLIEDNIPYSKDALDAMFKYLPERPTEKPKTPQEKDPLATVKIVPDPEKVKKQGLARPIHVEVPGEKKTPEQAEKPTEPGKKMTTAERKKQQEELVKRKLEEKAAEAAAENAALELILEETGKVAAEMVEKAVAAHAAAVMAASNHVQKLRKAMDIKEGDGNSQSEWDAVSAALDAKTEAVAYAEKLAEEARLELERLKAAVEEGRQEAITQKNKVLKETAEGLNKMWYDLESATNKLEKAIVEGQLVKDFQKLVEKGREQFKKELESIVPDVNLKTRRGKKLTEDELNSLIAHAHRRIEQLQKQLAEQEALERARMDTAVSRQEEEDTKLARAQLEAEISRLRSDFQLQRDTWDTEARVQFEQELRQQLARQAAAHSDHLAEMLKMQKQELLAKFDALLEQKLTDERDKFGLEVAGYIARLRGIEAAIEGRAELEKQGRQAQELWLACQALQAAISNSRGEGYWDEQLTPLAGEVASLREASNNHPFVTAVMDTIPKEALDRGVWTEDALKERFSKVRTIARRVAMIDEGGGTLFKYLISMLQSFFILKRAKTISSDDEIEPSALNTFTILDYAASCLEKGNLELAVRFVNQLTGEPRIAANDWLKEAKLLLETKMAADALLAYAGASGVGALPS